MNTYINGDRPNKVSKMMIIALISTIKILLTTSLLLKYVNFSHPIGEMMFNMHTEVCFGLDTCDYYLCTQSNITYVPYQKNSTCDAYIDCVIPVQIQSVIAIVSFLELVCLCVSLILHRTEKTRRRTITNVVTHCMATLAQICIVFVIVESNNFYTYRPSCTESVRIDMFYIFCLLALTCGQICKDCAYLFLKPITYHYGNDEYGSLSIDYSVQMAKRKRTVLSLSLLFSSMAHTLLIVRIGMFVNSLYYSHIENEFYPGQESSIYAYSGNETLSITDCDSGISCSYSLCMISQNSEVSRLEYYSYPSEVCRKNCVQAVSSTVSNALIYSLMSYEVIVSLCAIVSRSTKLFISTMIPSIIVACFALYCVLKVKIIECYYQSVGISTTLLFICYLSSRMMMVLRVKRLESV